MATQAELRSIAALIVVTLLTSICVIPKGGARASELPTDPAILSITVGGSPRQSDATPSADTVAEARWARPGEDYVLAEGGRIIPQRRTEVIAASTPSANALESSRDHFGSGNQADRSECGPSPATPAHITRLVVEAAQRHDVDVGLAVAIVTAESRLDRLRNSPKGARGPMQLMPETADRFGVSDICDPEENIDGGVRYLRELSDEFRNPLLVVAAYNAGEGRVREHGGIPPFKETVGYVAEVLNIQMGLEASGPTAGGLLAAVDDAQPFSNASGVIRSRERRQWVGGVMHF